MTKFVLIMYVFKYYEWLENYQIFVINYFYNKGTSIWDKKNH